MKTEFDKLVCFSMGNRIIEHIVKNLSFIIIIMVLYIPYKSIELNDYCAVLP